MLSVSKCRVASSSVVLTFGLKLICPIDCFDCLVFPVFTFKMSNTFSISLFWIKKITIFLTAVYRILWFYGIVAFTLNLSVFVNKTCANEVQ